MLSLIERIGCTIRQHSMIPLGSRIVVGLSGGADSVALAVLLDEMSTEGGFEIARIAHLNHGLRGPAADEDEAFCRMLAASLAVPIDVERVDVRALAREGRWSIEEAGREARYRFFNRVADLTGANRIAVGHTLEDQAETFLLNLLRGAGSRGLSGMHPVTGRVIRPLLDTRHTELRQFLAERGLTFREDETNRDTNLLRNRVRHLVMPFLEEQVSPGIAAVLARNAAIFRDDEAWMEAETMRAWDRTARSTPEGVELDCVALAADPPALARRIALRALETVSAGRFVGFDHAEALLVMARGEAPGSAADFPGVRAERVGARVILRPRSGPGRGRVETATEFCYVLSIPGEVQVPEAGSTVTAEMAYVDGVSGLEAMLAGSAGRIAVVDASALEGSLRVRSRLTGDRFRPLGLAGTKKLQDFFVDRKVAESERDTIPLVVDEADRIVWVAGHAICEDFRVTAQTGAVVILRLESWRDRA